MKKYHVATGDGKGYYGVGYESYRQAESLLKISQAHDPQAHIVEEAFTNADRIRAMSDEELANFLCGIAYARNTPWCESFARKFCDNCPTIEATVDETGVTMDFCECDFSDGKCPHGSDTVWWLQQPAEEDNPT